MEISTKSLEYIAVCSILIVIMWIFRDDTPKEIVYPKPDVSDQQFDSHPLIAWPEVDKRGNVCKIKYICPTRGKYYTRIFEILKHAHTHSLLNFLHHISIVFLFLPRISIFACFLYF